MELVRGIIDWLVEEPIEATDECTSDDRHVVLPIATLEDAARVAMTWN